MTDFKDEISLLIPAYLRGELSAADIERVEAAAANDPETVSYTHLTLPTNREV